METWGERLRLRARELGLTDIEVARRLGLAQGRYSAYVNMNREPDFALFVRICSTLATTPDYILGMSDAPSTENLAVAEILSSLRSLDKDSVGLVAALVRTVAAHRAGPAEVIREGQGRRRRPRLDREATNPVVVSEGDQ